MSEAVAQPSALNKNEIEELAKDIFKLSRDTRLKHAVDVGELVLVRAFQGSREIWNQRGQGDATLDAVSDAVAALGDTSWSRTTLFRAVRMAEQHRVFEGFDRWPRARYTHFRIVQGLAWDTQRALLDAVQQQGWNEIRLQAEATRTRGRVSEPAEEERSAKEAATSLKRIAKLVDIRDDLAADLDGAGLEGEEYAELLSLLAAVGEKSAALQERLRQLRKVGGSASLEANRPADHPPIR